MMTVKNLRLREGNCVYNIKSKTIGKYISAVSGLHTPMIEVLEHHPESDYPMFWTKESTIKCKDTSEETLLIMNLKYSHIESY